MKKRALSLLLALSLFTSAFAVAGEVNWPTKMLQVYLPWNAGGDTDLHCRKICEIIQKDLGVPVIVTNMAGAAGTVAARHVRDSAPDGYTILFSQSTFLVASLIGVADFSYKDLEVACTVAEDNSSVLVVKSGDDRFTDMKSFIEYGRDNDLLYGTSIGGHSQIQGLTVAEALGIQITAVDIGGTAEVIPALLSGDIDFAIGIYGTYKAYIDSGDYNALAIVGPTRVPGADIPSITEFGPDYLFTKLFGFYFPKGTDWAIIDKFNAAVEKAVNSEAFAEYAKIYNITPIFRGGKDALDYHDEQFGIMVPFKGLMAQ